MADQRNAFLRPRTPAIEDVEPDGDVTLDQDALDQIVDGQIVDSQTMDGQIVDSGDDGKPALDAEPEPIQPAGAAEDPVVSAAADRMLAQLAVAETVIERESRLGSLQLRLTELSGGWGPIVLASVGGVVLLAVGLGGLTLFGLLL